MRNAYLLKLKDSSRRQRVTEEGRKEKELYREIKTHAERLREKYPYYKEEAIASMVYLERKKMEKVDLALVVSGFLLQFCYSGAEKD